MLGGCGTRKGLKNIRKSPLEVAFMSVSVLILLILFSTIPSSSGEESGSGSESESANTNINSSGNSISNYYDFESDFGGIPFNYSTAALIHNSETLSSVLQNSANYSTLLIPDKTFHFYPGIYAQYVSNFNLLINGTLRFHRPPVTKTNHYDRPEPGILIEDSTDILISSPVPFQAYGRSDDDDGGDGDGDDSKDVIDTQYGDVKRGVVDGHGADYWGVPFIGYLQLNEFRPDLLVMNRTSNALIEYIIFRDAGLYTLHLHDMDELTIRYISIIARRTTKDGHGIYDLSAFNTDGIDVSGQNVHIHDVDIWNQDDCIAVKDAPSGISQNMLFERVNASGLGLTVGSIGGTTVRNITFRDSLLYKSYKGIYMKFRIDEWRETPGLIEDVIFENITMIAPEQWGIWIGPAQQSISGNVCHPSPCSLCWPNIPLAECNGMIGSQYKNITLKDVYIYNPLGSPGVILADESTPIEGLTFENVIVKEDVPLQWQTIDMKNTFPGMEEPIQDQYMYPLCEWVYSVVFGAILLLPVAMFTYAIVKYLTKDNAQRKQIHEPLLQQNKQPSSPPFQGKTIAMILGIAVIAVVVQRKIKTSDETYKVDRYFTCEGVVNGTAVGDTWPVPSCFVDETDKSTD